MIIFLNVNYFTNAKLEIFFSPFVTRLINMMDGSVYSLKDFVSTRDTPTEWYKFIPLFVPDSLRETETILK